MSDEEDTGQETGDSQEEAAVAGGEDGLGLEELENDMSAAMAGGGVDSDDEDEEDAEQAKTAADLEAVFDIPVNVSAVLGKAHLPVSQLLKLSKGAVVELDRKVGEAIDIYVNNRLVARGEVVVVEDHLGVTMTEIIKSDGH